MKRYIHCSISPRQSEYLNYLTEHIQAVRDSWDILEKAIRDSKKYDDQDLMNIRYQIQFHDESKYSDEELDPYCNYFYPSPGFEKDDESFNRAWLHHQHNNPHHWQYHVLINDDKGEQIALDMSFPDICEMVCDWHSFSRKDPKSTASTWYNKNKSDMILSKNTRKTVEDLIKYLEEPLKSEKESIL